MSMEVLDKGDENVWIRLEGRLDLKGVEAVQLGFTVKASRSEKPVAVDLAGVTFVGSLAIGMLFAAARNLRMRGSRLVLFGSAPHIDEVLRNASLDQVAELVAGEDAAKAALSGA